MDSLSKETLTKVLNAILIFSIIISLLGFFADLRNTLAYGGIDLRNRVVGARLLTSGMDPYYFKWQPGDDERLLDPLDKFDIPITRVTVPPTVLLFYATLAHLPYSQQRLLWLGLQWLALLATLKIMVRVPASVLRSKFLAINGLLLFAASNFWRLHVDRGQVYIFYVFVLALAYWVAQRKFEQWEIWSGLLIGLTASLRFPIIIMTLPMLLFRRFRLFAATWVGFLGCLLSSVFIVGDQVWKSYFSAMKGLTGHSVDAVNLPRKNLNVVLPNVIEGMTNLRLKATLPGDSASLRFNVDSILGITLSSSHLIALLAVILLIFSAFLLSRKSSIKHYLGVDLIFLSGSLIILLADFFIPALRYSYNNVQFLIPLLLLLKHLKLSDHRGILLYLFLVMSLLIASGTFFWLPREGVLGTYLAMITIFWMAIMILNGKILRDANES
jgi:hypothetical protein